MFDCLQYLSEMFDSIRDFRYVLGVILRTNVRIGSSLDPLSDNKII